MKLKIDQLFLVVAILCGTMCMTSCQGLVDAIFGEHTDNPTQPTTQPTTPDDPKDPSTDPATIVKATDLLQDAQKEGATVVIWFMYEGDLYRAVFKKTGDDYVLQNGAAATRGGSGAVISNIPNGLDVTLKSGAESNSDAMLVTVTDKSTGKAILQATIDTDTGNIEQLSSTGSYLTGLAIAGTEGISEDVMNSTEAVLTGKAEQEDYDNLVKEDAAGVMLPCVKEDGTISLESMEELTADTKPEEQKDIINQTVDTNKNASEEESGGEEGGGEDPAPIIVDVAVTGVALNKTELTLTIGDTYNLTATVSPDNATNKTVTWASDNKAVATVDSEGKVTAVAAGEATITVTTVDGEKKATCKVTVNKKAGKVAFTTAAPSQAWSATAANNTYKQTATNTGDAIVTYSINDNSCDATIDSSTGEVSFTKVGSVKVTATVEDTETYTYAMKSASYTLTINKAAGSISYANKTVEKETTDGNFTNKLTVVGDGKVTYSSDKESVATVNKNGQVTIKGAGEATITATVADSDTYTYAEKTATYKLKVSGGLTDYNVKTETDW